MKKPGYGPTILSALGVVGVILTGVSATKATIKHVGKEQEERSELKWERIESVMSVYIPVVLYGIGTIACILAANEMSRRTRNSILSAYALLNSGHMLPEEDIQENTSEEELVDEQEELPLFYDLYSNRYFHARETDVVRTMYEINKKIQTAGYAEIDQYFRTLKITRRKPFVGWDKQHLENTYGKSWVDFQIEKVQLDGGMECKVLTFNFIPATVNSREDFSR